MAGMQQFDEAMALLASCPETLPRYKAVAVAMKEIYAAYRQKACGDILQKARGACALGNYEESVQWLDEIDMGSPCANDAAAFCRLHESCPHEVESKRLPTFAPNRRGLPASILLGKMNCVRKGKGRGASG